MTEDKLIDLIQKVETKTATGGLKWDKTANDNEFQATLATFIIRIQQFEGRESTDYTLNIIDKDGVSLESVTDGDLYRMIQRSDAFRHSELNGIDLMRSIFKNAKRHALGVDKAIDDILSELG
jgi:hypothetical protein